MTSFSLIRNLQQLFHFTENKDFGYVHALKMISLSIIIYGHRRLYSLGYPNLNPERTEIVSKLLVCVQPSVWLNFYNIDWDVQGPRLDSYFWIYNRYLYERFLIQVWSSHLSLLPRWLWFLKYKSFKPLDIQLRWTKFFFKFAPAVNIIIIYQMV